MKRKRFAKLMMVAAGLLLISGCGGGQGVQQISQIQQGLDQTAVVIGKADYFLKTQVPLMSVVCGANPSGNLALACGAFQAATLFTSVGKANVEALQGKVNTDPAAQLKLAEETKKLLDNIAILASGHEANITALAAANPVSTAKIN